MHALSEVGVELFAYTYHYYKRPRHTCDTLAYKFLHVRRTVHTSLHSAHM